MELKIMVKDLEYIPEISGYNHNYYKLPIPINGCDILLSESDDDYLTLWSLGKFVDGKFIRNCWLGESSIYNSIDDEYINLLNANEEMIWF